MTQSRLLADRVYDWLQSQCAQRRFPNQSHLSAGQISRELDVSPSTVRQALTRAIKAGWVQRSPNGRPVLIAYPPPPRKQPTEFDPGNGHINVAHATILEKVLAGELRPNATVSAKRLSDELDVSIASVREALESLSSRGLLRRQPRCGWRVTVLTPPEVRDVFRLRLFLEPLLVRFAARHVSDELLDALSERNADCAQLIPLGNRRQADYDFHCGLAKAADRPILIGTLEPLLQRLFMNPMHGGEVNDAAAEHQAVLDALRAGDAELAADRMRHHLKCARDRYLKDRAGAS